MIDLKVFGVHRSERKIVKNEKFFSLEKFHHISIKDRRKNRISPYIKIKCSDKNLIKIENYADTMLYSFVHQIINDTLKIVSQDDQPFMHEFTILTNSKIQSINTEKSNIEIEGFRQDYLRIYQNQGQLRCYGNDSRKTSKFNKLNIIQNDAYMKLQNIHVDTLEIHMIKSRTEFDSDIAMLNAKIMNHSKLQLRNVAELNFKKDDSSKIHFN